MGRDLIKVSFKKSILLHPLPNLGVFLKTVQQIKYLHGFVDKVLGSDTFFKNR